MTRLSRAEMRLDVPTGSTLDLNFRDESITYTGIPGNTIKIKQTFNYIQVYNESASEDIYITLHEGKQVVPTDTYGVVRIPSLGGYEEVLDDVGWISLTASGACKATIILKKGGLV